MNKINYIRSDGFTGIYPDNTIVGVFYDGKELVIVKYERNEFPIIYNKII
jgi:hypothetical protein